MDILVNNAGYGIYRPFVESGREAELGQLRLLVEAPVDLMARYLPGMVERRRGTIINLCSSAVARDALATAERGRISVIPGGPPVKAALGPNRRSPGGSCSRSARGRHVAESPQRARMSGMDTSTIDQAYQQVQGEFQDVANSIQGLAQKLQAAAQAGDANAKEWLLDLKQIALDVKDEQIQVNGLLQAIHGFVDNTHQQYQQQYQQMPPQVVQQMPSGMFGGGGGGGGMLGGFLNSGFGRAMEMGAGIGLGEDLINSIF